ncbi:MAG: RidA family protein [Rhodospirillaceae bacterium]|nr:RidA family protein [Rhodospirillaceae bacterium]
MTDTLRHINPPTLTNSLAVGYSQVVVGNGRLVFVAGQVGWNAQGVMATTFEAEVRQALENVRAALKAAGAGTDDVASIRYYIVGLTRERVGALSVALRELGMWNWQKPPAGTVVGVQTLARPEFNIEIEAYAIIPA